MKKLFIIFIGLGLIGFSLWYNRYSEKHNPEYRFSKIYQSNEWGKSGPGSDPANAVPYLQILQQFFDDERFHTIVDLGSGDWRLMEKINIPSNKIYKGFDIVGTVIRDAQNKHSRDNVRFYHIHTLEEFKNEKADLLIIKDVMHHWSNESIKYFIKNILPNFKYALITNDYETLKVNSDIKAGHFRPIDIEAEPFNIKNLELLTTYRSHGVNKRVYLYSNPQIMARGPLN